MPTHEQILDDIHLEVFAPTGGFILGVSVLGDLLGGDSFRIGISKVGDELSDGGANNQWVDYINDATNIFYNRGAAIAGATNTVQVGLLNADFRNAANPLTDFKIRSGRKVRLRYGAEILFSGNLTTAKGRSVRNKTTYTKYFNLQIADTVKKLSAIKVYGAGGLTEPYESFEDRIARILDTYDGVVEYPTGDAYPGYKLSATVYESTLTSHLDLACNSVGASWYIDKLGQIRFNTVLTDYITGVFTDGTHTESVENPLNYYDLNIEYDNKNHINYLELANKGIIEDPNNPGEEIAAETSTIFSDVTSVASNGYLKSTLDTNLYIEGAYSSSLTTRADEILNTYADPQPTITKIFFNVQENFIASQMETLHLVEVWHEGIKHTLRVVGISATIYPKEWLLELELTKDI